jgi:hypothetical protein
MNDTESQGCQQNTSLNCLSVEEQQNQNLTTAAILMWLIGILALLFNGGVLVLIIKEKKIRKNPYYFFVLMLCVSDSVAGLGIVFSTSLHLILGFQVNMVVAIVNVLLMITGLHLSLYHTFLISFQRFLVIWKEQWSSCIFRGNRKYYFCAVGWIGLVLGNCVFISPPMDIGTTANTGAILFVYKGHYQLYMMYTRFLSLTLLSSTILLYLAAIAVVLKTYRKVNPIGHLNNVRVIQVMEINTTESSPSENACTSSSVQNQVRVGQGTSQVQHSNWLNEQKRKKVVSTLQLVGLLITALVIFTGPFVVALLWSESFPIQISRVFFICCCINSVLNPFIYVWKLVDIREKVKSILCCCCK